MYAHLISGTDEQARKDFDRDLYAPLAGWDMVQRRMFAIIEGG